MPTNSITNYDFQFNLNTGDLGDSGAFTFSSQVGMTDEIALSIVSFFQGLPWAAGITPFATVARHQQTDVMTTGDPNTGVFA